MPIDATSIVAVDGSRRGDGAVRPLAEGYTFAALPATVERLLTGHGLGGLPRSALGDAPERVDRVVLILLDAFGWRFFARHASMNSFVETVLHSLSRGELMRWRPRVGARPVG